MKMSALLDLLRENPQGVDGTLSSRWVIRTPALDRSFSKQDLSTARGLTNEAITILVRFRSRHRVSQYRGNRYRLIFEYPRACAPPRHVRLVCCQPRAALRSSTPTHGWSGAICWHPSAVRERRSACW